VKERTPERFRKEVEVEWALTKGGPVTLTEEEVRRVARRFTRPVYAQLPGNDAGYVALQATEPGFAAWAKRNVHPHKVAGYAAVTLSLKKTGVPPGDITADQMDAVADLADAYAQGEVRVSHEQNLILADVRQSDLHVVWQKAKTLGFATPNIGMITNIIACPGGDFCSLANAKSIPVAEAIQRRFDDLDHVYDIGELDLNISGCMNSCGHHHVGHIGILGVDKNGEEWYQISIGGNQGLTRPGAPAGVGKVIGPSFAQDDIPDVIEKLIGLYLERRESEAERFIDVVWRIGVEPFKKRVYGDHHQRPESRSGSLAAA
jgi:sulfite reductase (NADPH) hemoprotein beta-component